MKRSIISLVVLVAVALVAMSVFTPRQSAPVVDILPAGPVEVRGSFVCLPHKPGGEYVTKECAFGMRGEDGVHYALDFGSSPTSAFDLPMDRPFIVRGHLVPIELLSTDHWRRYDVKGIITVSGYEELVEGIPEAILGTQTILELKKPVVVAGTTIRVSAVTEDSRCPMDAVCIQAGRAEVVIDIVSPSGPATFVMEIGDMVTTETLSISLDEVRPYPISTHKTADDEYRFVVTIDSHPNSAIE